MSRPEQLQLDCPSCSNSQSVTCWSSVNATLDPQLKEKLIEGDLNFFTCSKCQGMARIPWDVLYHDMERKIMISLVHNDDMGEVQLPDRARSIFEQTTRDYQLRTVRSYPQLVEKIFIFDEGMDDRVVEFLKYWIWEEHGPKQYPPDERLFFERLTNDPEQEPGLGFVLFDESGNRGYYKYPWNTYLEVVTLVRDQLGDLAECVGSWVTVNSDFVLRMLDEDGA